MDFLDELQHRVLPGDGAMGTELIAAGAPRGHCLEELCVSAPEMVSAIHEQYIAAGARVIETNSFGANAVRLSAHGCEHRVSEINWTAAQLAKDVARGTGVYVAGSVGPLGITAEEAEKHGIDRHEVFTDQIGALLDGGCNVIFLETFLDVDELLIALNAKQSLHHCPAVAMLAIEDAAELARAFERLRAADADVVGVNCLNGPQVALSLLGKITDPGPLAAFPNSGLPEITDDGHLLYSTTPEEFVAASLGLIEKGVRLIGGCCGIGPSHIAALAAAVEKVNASR